MLDKNVFTRHVRDALAHLNEHAYLRGHLLAITLSESTVPPPRFVAERRFGR